eukprot:CAMPEP_0114595520 /NCGR_PEP_ID=MMETSP0125-20121206/17323_1 /TAXON_ID=485358 ORGANISM="Aristerostoma sp., Strain ATCC 50986" /NCGR_SAMPLE_ID=MMETSP0125 /ASSEMBLY_ACC=CAM_ASM_000245 /LENGTH=212 /DNA_ID=CAMNT_0001797199 /DNA_START=76 /DNA_END=710 /DNA_ORIENTATION=-
MSLLEIHGAICIPNQDLNGHELQKFMNILGTALEYPEFILADDYLETQEIYAVQEFGNVKKDGTIDPDAYKSGTVWYQDGDLYQYPENLFYVLFNAKVVPPVGGDLAFKDLRKAYKDVDQSIRDKYEGATYIFDTEGNPDFANIPDADRIPKITHSTTFTHPVRGEKSFYLCSQYGKVELKDGTIEPASVLYDLVVKETPQYVHKYTLNDLV